MKHNGVTRRRDGYTLIEVILAIGLMTLLLGAVYQTLSTHVRAQEQTTDETQRVLRARSLLHRIANELRTVVAADSGAGADPAPQARHLLDIGGPNAGLGNLSPDDTAIPSNSTELRPLDRFALLGRTDRIVLTTRTSVAPQPQRGQTDITMAPEMSSANEELKPRSGIRQIVYAFKRPPIQSTTITPTDSNASLTPDTDASAGMLNEAPPPPPGPLLRQETLFPTAVAASMEAKSDLERRLAEEPMTAPNAEPSTQTAALTPTPTTPETPALPAMPGVEKVALIRTQTLADDVIDLRFRYYDGAAWFDQWDDAGRLPVAVEIAVRFAGDVEDELPEGATDVATLEADANAAAPINPLESTGLVGRRWFIHRLTVALPAAASKVRWQQGAADSATERMP